MAVTQESRYRMHQRLEEVLGDEPATTLMEHLPPTGWADLATKKDVAHATELTSQRIDALDERLTGKVDALDERLTGKIDALDERLTGRIDALDERLTGRIDALDERLTGRIDASHASLGHRIDAVEHKMTMHIAELRSEFHKTLVGGVFAMMATNAVLMGIALTLTKGG